MKCHFEYNKQYGKVLITGCYKTVFYGIDYCTCRIADCESDKIKELEKENARLNRIIKRIYKNVR